MTLDTIISVAHTLSIIGFFIAFILMGMAVFSFGKSALGSIFAYLYIGTGVFLFITLFLKLGGGFLGVSDETVDFWWHIMFYTSFVFYFFGLKKLVELGSGDGDPHIKIGAEKKWGLLAVLIVVVAFVGAHVLEPVTDVYTSSALASLGLHHFIAFAFAGLVAYYLSSVKSKLGMIGKAIANAMILAIIALSLQHLWELLNESWKVVRVTSSVGEGVEQIFLIVAAIAMSYAAWRLKKNARG